MQQATRKPSDITLSPVAMKVKGKSVTLSFSSLTFYAFLAVRGILITRNTQSPSVYKRKEHESLAFRTVMVFIRVTTQGLERAGQNTRQKKTSGG